MDKRAVEILERLRGRWHYAALVAAGVIYAGHGFSKPQTESVYVAPETAGQNFDADSVVNRAFAQESDATANLYAYLNEERAREIDAIAREFTARAIAFQADPAYVECYQRDIAACLVSFLDARGQTDTADMDTWEAIRLRTEVEAIALAIVRAMPPNQLTDAQKSFADARDVPADGHVGATPNLLALQVDQVVELHRTRQTAERTAQQTRPAIAGETEGNETKNYEDF